MKKIAILGVLGVFCSLGPVFSEDVRTLPARVFRAETLIRYSFANAYFDIGRQYTAFKKNEGAFKALSMGFAAAYGITDWLSAGILWLPGLNLWYEVERVFRPSDTVTLADFYDMLMEIKVQLIGQQGLIKNRRFRLALGPQIKIPLPGPDYEEQAKNLAQGKPVILENQDRHVWGLGGKIHSGFIINESLYVDLYAEGIFYPQLGKLSRAGLDDYLYSLSPFISHNSMVRYLGDLRFELDPHLEQALNSRMILNIGLPLIYSLNCGVWYYSSLPNMPAQYRLSLQPNVTLFFPSPPLPFEIKISYSIPLWGKDWKAVHNLAFLARVYITGR
jgi:hypothetical protein